MPRRLRLLLAFLLFVTGSASFQGPTAYRPTPSPPVPFTPTPGDVATAVLDDPTRIAAAQPVVRDPAALMRAFKQAGAVPSVTRTTPLDVQEGAVETFWVSDAPGHPPYTITARLRYVGPVALMYVDTRVTVDQGVLERAATTFEAQIYPRTRALFGLERAPGIDGDPRLTILHTPLASVGGYFSSADALPRAINRFSNEREMFVINLDSYPLGTDGYLSVLAHELQHMIQANQRQRAPTWFNEGMSTLAQDLNGYVEHGMATTYLADPDVALTGWSQDAAVTGDHYGAAQLFLRYVMEHYGGEQHLQALIAANAGAHRDVFAHLAAQTRPDIKTFADLYADWAVANVVNDPVVGDGRYAYTLLPDYAALSMLEAGTVVTTVQQFGADYLGVLDGPRTLTFEGAQAVALVPARPASGDWMWWSNRGDDTVSTLTRAVDLRGVAHATLQFSAWYELERHYDYGYVTVSTDSGTSWTTLEGRTTTRADPQGQNLGHGLTGVSGAPDVEAEQGTPGRWAREQMDLSAYAGQEILLRFWVVNDAGQNAQGLLLDDLRIPELDYQDDVEQGMNGWEAVGFVRTTGRLPQTWALRLVRAREAGITVERVAVDAQGQATVRLDAGERGILVVSGTAPLTTTPATYRYVLGEPGQGQAAPTRHQEQPLERAGGPWIRYAAQAQRSRTLSAPSPLAGLFAFFGSPPSACSRRCSWRRVATSRKLRPRGSPPALTPQAPCD